MLKLVKPSRAYLDQIQECKDEYIKYQSSFDGTNSLKDYDSISDWIDACIAFEKRETIPDELKDKYVPAVTFLVIREEDDKLVGFFNCRLELNDYLRSVGGNIGYSIRPSERKQGYAKLALRLVLDYLTEYGLDEALITCHDYNEASRRTILSQGGIYQGNTILNEKETIQRYIVPLRFNVDKEYEVIRFLGRGKDGYSYVVEDNKGSLYTLKKMHYEDNLSCKGKKIEQEINAYNRILMLGIKMPKLVYRDMDNEIIVKEYIDGPTIQELINEGLCINKYIPLVQKLDSIACQNWLTLSYVPANFVVHDDEVYYIDYECNVYSEEENFENWGIDSWIKSN